VIVAGVISLTSARVSIGTIFHFKKKLKAAREYNDATSVEIRNEPLAIKSEESVIYTCKKQTIHLETVDERTHGQLLMEPTSSLETGLPNKTAEILTSGALGVLASAEQEDAARSGACAPLDLHDSI